MSSICGLVGYNNNITYTEDLINISYNNDLNNNRRLTFTHHNKHGVFIGLSGKQANKYPCSIIYKNIKYTFVFDGILYNGAELIKTIKDELGYLPVEKNDFGGIAAWSYILWGGFSPQKLCGKFIYAIYSEAIFDNSVYSPKLFLARDKLGIKPLYFTTVNNDEIIFSSSLKSILSHKKISAKLDKYGLWQILFLGGETIDGKTLFGDIYELQPGFCAYIDCRRDGTHMIMQKRYFILKHPQLVKNTDCTLNNLCIEQKYIEDLKIDTENINLDDLNDCVRITEAPYYVYNYQKIKLLSENGEDSIFSKIGSDAFNFYDESYIKSFFPWISDPYRNIEFFRREGVFACEGFNWLFEIFNGAKGAFTFDEDKNISQNRIKMCMYYFYNTPNQLKYNEKVSDYYSLNVNYIFSNNNTFEFYYYNPEQLSTQKCNPHFIKKPKINSGLENSLKCNLKEIISNPEYKINCLLDKDRVTSLLDTPDSTASLQFLYLLHTWLEEFNVELNLE